jgi:phage shock protein A
MWESNEGDASFRRWESRLTALEEELSAEAELLGLTDRLEQEFEALQAEQAMERGLADLRRDLPTN